MKLSVDKNYQGYCLNAFQGTVHFNGQLHKFCIAADEEDGVIVAYKVVDGKIVTEGDRVVTEILNGDVKITIPPDWKPILE